MIELAETPDAVKVPETLAPTLMVASRAIGGALAIVSGRTLDVIDRLMTPLRLPAAGEHGAAIRLPDGSIQNAAPTLAIPDEWKQRVRRAADGWNGTVVEYKPYSIAAHFRLAPSHGPDVRRLFENIIAEDSRDFELLPARMAFEIRRRNLNKGAAVHELMKHAPFHGRVPVFVGDDVTDEDGFRAAAEMGGLGLHVGQSFDGKPSEVRRWLETFRSTDAG
ncbi:MAG: trehalose-phosphatase [Alphaproteobacteria bacterium]|nr:trehalose-phosphatase [Alphaproteobacteria bacterium]